MKTFLLVTLGTAAWFFIAPAGLQAQNAPPPGNFDPAQMRQRMMERMREQLEVTDDAEWKAISERIKKVQDLRRAGSGFGPGPGGFPAGPGGPPPGAGAGAGPGAAPGAGGPGALGGPGGPGGPPPGFNRPSSPELDALRKAVDTKAPAAELKSLVAEVKAARAKRQAELEKAQEELRQVLSARQEAVAVSLGLL